MQILVLSDSHSHLAYMRKCVEKIKPDCILHLGDMFPDGREIASEYPDIPLYQVPGNCDAYRGLDEPEVLHPVLDGVRFYMSHGHLHHVKSGTELFVCAAKADGAQVALFGHTHMAECWQEDGIWVMNPGTCGYFGATAGLIRVQDGKVLSCQIIR